MRNTVDDRDNVQVFTGSGGTRRGFGNGRAIATLAGVCLLLVLAVVLIQQVRATFDPLARAQQEAELYRTQQLDSDLYTVDMVAGAVLRLVLPVGHAFALLGVVIVGLVLVYQRWAAPVAVQAFYHVEGLKAQYQLPVPHTLTQTINGGKSIEAHAPALPPALDHVAPALPGLVDLAALNHTPTPQSVLLGLDENNQRVTVPLNALLHVATTGPTGGGKSNIQRLLLGQLLALGARVAIGDPKWTPYDAEQDENWRPIEKRLHLAPAVSASEIGGLLDYTHGEMMKRLEQRRKGEKISAPLFVCLDELPWIADNVKGSADQIGELVRLGRGVKVFTIAAAQDWLAKTVGMSSARDNFRTAMYLGGDLKTGAVLLDMPQRELSGIEGELSLGVALVRSASTTPARLVRVPYVSNESLYTMLGGTVPAPVQDDAAQPSRRFGFMTNTKSEPVVINQPQNSHTTTLDYSAPQSQALTAEEQRVIDLFVSGKDAGAIVMELYQMTSKAGKPYMVKLAEVQAVIRAYIVKNLGLTPTP